MDYQKRKNEWSKYNENGYDCYRWHAIGCKCNLCVSYLCVYSVFYWTSMDYQKRKNEWSKYNENGYDCYRWHAIGCKCNLCVNPGTKIELIAKKVGMIMKKQVIGCSRFVKILGIITTVMFGLISLVTLISGYYIAAFCFLPFVFLGGALLVACKKQTIIIDDNALTFNYVLKHSIEVRYADIRCLLLIPLGNRKQMALIDRDYNRLVTLDYALGNLEILYEALALHEVKIVDFEELLDKKKDVSKYVRTFNAIERNYYRSIIEENKTIESISSNKCGFDLNKSKKILRILGFVFIALDVIGFFIGGKMMMVLLVFVILGSYAVYLWYYPYIYILRILGFVFIALDVIGFFIGGKMMMVLLVFVILGSYAVYLWYYPYIYILKQRLKKVKILCFRCHFLELRLLCF